MVGFSVSVILTDVVHVRVLPWLSVALKVTTVVPMPNLSLRPTQLSAMLRREGLQGITRFSF